MSALVQKRTNVGAAGLSALCQKRRPDGFEFFILSWKRKDRLAAVSVEFDEVDSSGRIAELWINAANCRRPPFLSSGSLAERVGKPFLDRIDGFSRHLLGDVGKLLGLLGDGIKLLAYICGA
jgi:hypothetical protein